jgi:excisionase family DNA binding protein
MSEDRLTYRLDEVIRLTGLSRATLYRLSARRELPFIKICGRTLVARIDLEAFIDQMRARGMKAI